MKIIEVKNDENLILDKNEYAIKIIDDNNNLLDYCTYIIEDKMAKISQINIMNKENEYLLIKAVCNNSLRKNCNYLLYENNKISLIKNYKHILIDLDDTIFDFKKSEKEAFIITMKYFNVECSLSDCIKFSNINEKYFQIFAEGKLKRIEFQQERFKRFFMYKNIKRDAALANEIFLKTLGSRSDLFDDSLEFLKELSEKYNLYVASNGMYEVQINRLKSSNIIDYFKKIYVSSKIGVNKPSELFFNYIFNDLNDYDKNNYLIIGDREESDMLGGINSKIDTCYLNRDGKDSKNIYTYEIKSLLDIIKILKN